ncbi:MAG: zinc ribbon domain-containing protein [Candidatus Sumerlaeota bacterium]|nr:zinc ribbon domain-containing protein [Candidatus Sumerlaeota bacterium]
MPTYEYQCKACGAMFERQQSITEAPLAQCPECNGEVQRLVSGSGFLLKGTGHGGSGHGNGCSFESSGRTCCGRDERCDSPSCGG